MWMTGHRCPHAPPGPPACPVHFRPGEVEFLPAAPEGSNAVTAAPRRDECRRVVARSKSGHGYVVYGRDAGMGRTIEHTADLLRAHNFGSAAGVMKGVGGFYHHYEAVAVLVVAEEVGTQPFPPESEVWDE